MCNPATQTGDLRTLQMDAENADRRERRFFDSLSRLLPDLPGICGGKLLGLLAVATLAVADCRYLAVQEHAEEVAMSCQPVLIVVVDKAQLPEPVHEMTDPRPGCADHLCQVSLTDPGKHKFGSAFLAKMSEQQEDPGEPPFARVEQLVHEIRFVEESPCWKMQRPALYSALDFPRETPASKASQSAGGLFLFDMTTAFYLQKANRDINRHGFRHLESRHWASGKESAAWLC